jgi:uncharacterized damage-inducible protein DinB
MKDQFTDTIENSKNYTIAVAEAMPESGYQIKPISTVWNFGELMNHIAYGIGWWTKNYIKKEETSWNPPEVKQSKKETIDNLEQAYRFLKDSLIGASITEEKINGLHATLDHITHHRGQATIYLRLNGITPPDYTY